MFSLFLKKNLKPFFLFKLQGLRKRRYNHPAHAELCQEARLHLWNRGGERVQLSEREQRKQRQRRASEEVAGNKALLLYNSTWYLSGRDQYVLYVSALLWFRIHIHLDPHSFYCLGSGSVLGMRIRNGITKVLTNTQYKILYLISFIYHFSFTFYNKFDESYLFFPCKKA
jgi:hypothetical protein